MSLTPYGAEIERANRRHRMDERNRIFRMMQCAAHRVEFIFNDRHVEMLENLIAHCESELDTLNAELGL